MGISIGDPAPANKQMDYCNNDTGKSAQITGIMNICHADKCLHVINAQFRAYSPPIRIISSVEAAGQISRKAASAAQVKMIANPNAGSVSAANKRRIRSARLHRHSARLDFSSNLG